MKMYLALNNQQWLICYRTKSNQTDFVSHTKEEFQVVKVLFSKICTIFLGGGLFTISLKKTPQADQPYVEQTIFVQGARLGVVDSSVYLGSTQERDALILK